MAGRLGYYNYTTDDGGSYVVKMDATNAALVGNVAATGTDNVKLPPNYVPRYVTLSAIVAISGVQVKLSRTIVVGDPESTFWQTPTALSLNVEGAGSVSFMAGSAVGEVRRELMVFP